MANSNEVASRIRRALNQLYARKPSRERNILAWRANRLLSEVRVYERSVSTQNPDLYRVEYGEVPVDVVRRVKRWLRDVDGFLRRSSRGWQKPRLRPSFFRSLTGLGSKQQVFSRRDPYASAKTSTSYFWISPKTRWDVFRQAKFSGFGQVEESVAQAADRSVWPQVIAVGSVGVITLGLVYLMGKETLGRAY